MSSSISTAALTDADVLRVMICGTASDDKKTAPAYLHLASEKRRFIITEIDGQEPSIRNTISAASASQVALLVVDASSGIDERSRRQAILLAQCGLRHLALIINKMDEVDFKQDVFEQTEKDFRHFVKKLGFEQVDVLPQQKLDLKNLAHQSKDMPWYDGSTVMNWLDNISIPKKQKERLVFPVQSSSQSGDAIGSVAEGSIKVGDEIRVTASGQIACVADIITFDGNRKEAHAGEAVTLTFTAPLQVTRGDVLSASRQPLESTDQFEATLIWLDKEDGLIGRSYEIRLATQSGTASVTSIKHKIDIHTLAHQASKKMSCNDISVCNLATSKPLVCDNYQQSPTLGAFILIDRVSQSTVAVGMVHHSLRRAQNVHRQVLSVNRAAREQRQGHKGQVIWFTGLSGSGKSTIANALEVALHLQGRRTYILDGDNIRQGLNKDLGFTDSDRVENIRRIAEVAKLMMDAGIIVMTAFISPFRRERDMARELIGAENFMEIFADTPLETCEKRDVKGLYKKARAGLLPNMSGIDSPYEAPLDPALRLKGEQTLEESVKQILALIESESGARK